MRAHNRLKWLSVVLAAMTVFIFQNCADTSFKKLEKPSAKSDGVDELEAGSLVVLSAPQDQTVVAGENASFFVIVSEEGGMQAGYQWVYEGVPISGQIDSQLLINSVEQDQAGTYGVQIYGDGELLNVLNAQLNVQACAPGATQQCSIANGQGSQTCSADGSGYGACTAVSCNSGYTLQNGACVKEIIVRAFNVDNNSTCGGGRCSCHDAISAYDLAQGAQNGHSPSIRQAKRLCQVLGFPNVQSFRVRNSPRGERQRSPGGGKVWTNAYVQNRVCTRVTCTTDTSVTPRCPGGWKYKAKAKLYSRSKGSYRAPGCVR